MAVAKVEARVESPLKWPDGMERTHIKQRKAQKSWKKPWRATLEALQKELVLMGATSILVTKAGADTERMDPGVAVWFSMAKEDFSWQQGLGLESPAPTLAEIDSAYRERAKVVHPDHPSGGDPAMFKKITEWRQAAKAWVTDTHTHRHEYVMAIDQYGEAQLNLNALKLAFFYIRGLERVGAPQILTQTLGAFRAKLTGGTTL